MILPRAAGLAAWCLAVAAVGLAGCAQVPGPATSPGAHFAGRIAVRVDGDAARSVSAGFDLQGSADAGELQLTSPLGTIAARARWQPGLALLQAGGEERRFADLDDLTQAAIGEALPLAALFDWLAGRPWPPAPSRTRSDGEAGFEQLGWSVSLARFADGWVEAVRREPPPVTTVRVRLDRDPS